MKVSKTVFEQLSIEKTNWLGANDTLLEECIEAGSKLVEENERFERSIESYQKDFKSSVLNGLWLALVIVGIAIGGLLTYGAIINPKLKIAAAAYRQGQIDALAQTNILYEKTTTGYGLRREAPSTITVKRDGKVYEINLEE